MYLNKSKKVVIKIGSSILVDSKGKPKKKWLAEFANDIKLLISKKKQVIIGCLVTFSKQSARFESELKVQEGRSESD